MFLPLLPTWQDTAAGHVGTRSVRRGEMSFVPLPFVHVPVTHLSYSSSTSVTSPVTELPPPLRPPLPVPLGPSPGGIGSGAQLVAMARERHPLQAHAREQAMAGRRASTSPLGPGPAPRPGGHLPALLAGRTRRAPWPLALGPALLLVLLQLTCSCLIWAAVWCRLLAPAYARSCLRRCTCACCNLPGLLAPSAGAGAQGLGNRTEQDKQGTEERELAS